MTTYKTGNPIGSAAAKDLFDNAQNFDKAVNELVTHWIDRLGVQRLTEYGRQQLFDQLIESIKEEGEDAISSVGWQEAGDWAVGLQLKNRNQIVLYNGSWYKFLGELPHTISGDSPENDGGIWSSTNTSGAWVNIGDATIRSSLIASDGFKLIGQCPNIETLREIEPTKDGQVILFYSVNSDAKLPLGGGEWIHFDWMTKSEFPDDGGTIVNTTAGAVWVRRELITQESPSILVTWFGAKNSYLEDTTEAIQAACDAAEFWSEKQISDKTNYGPLGERIRVVMPARWVISSTITIRTTLCFLDLNRSIGVVLSTGEYADHPILPARKMAFYLLGDKPSDDTYLPAYHDFPIAINGTIECTIISNGRPDSSIYSQSEDNGISCFSQHGISESLYSSVGYFSNVSISGFGDVYTNGDYAWGVLFDNCKFVSNYRVSNVIAAKDNGESLSFTNCRSFNNAKFINFNDWGGEATWDGGSFDYFKGKKPVVWGDNGTAQLWINNVRFEWNPSKTETFVEMGNTSRSARFALRNFKMLMAVPDGSDAAVGPFINQAFDMQASTVEGVVLDHSSSAALTRGYKWFGDAHFGKVSNILSDTLIDYFSCAGCLNRKGISSWQYIASSAFEITMDSLNLVIKGTANAVAGNAKEVYVFIPRSDFSKFNKITSLLACNRSDVIASYSVWVGYSQHGGVGNVSSGLLSDYPIGSEGSFTLEVGANTPHGIYSGVKVDNYSDTKNGEVANGLIVKINLYNMGNGHVVSLGVNSGLITV